MNVEEYLSYDAVGLADLVRSGEVSPESLVRCATERHEQTAASINAVVEIYDDSDSVADPDGVLAGVPILRKDYGSTEAGRLVEMGSALARGVRATETSVFFGRLAAAGAVTVGRSAVPEFIQHGSTETRVFGATRNPHCLDLSSGGSSGGSAAAVAAGVVPAASASDCAGSIRIPAATCGLVGLKPGRRRVPWETGGWGGIAEEFVVTRTVRDASLFLDVLGDGQYASIPGQLRVGISTDHWAGRPIDAAVVEVAEATGKLLESFGHSVSPVAQPLAHHEVNSTWHALFTRWVAADVAALVLATGRAADETALEPLTILALEAADQLTVLDISNAQLTQGRLTHRLGQALADIDVLLTPTLGRVEIPLGSIAGEVESFDDYFDLNDMLFPYSYPFNIAGWPSLTIPGGRSKGGLPIGVQLSARPGQERTLLEVAAHLETANPWPRTAPLSEADP